MVGHLSLLSRVLKDRLDWWVANRYGAPPACNRCSKMARVDRMGEYLCESHAERDRQSLVHERPLKPTDYIQSDDRPARLIRWFMEAW